MFVWSVASSKDVVGEIARRPLDTAPFCLVNNRVCEHVIPETGVCLHAAAGWKSIIRPVGEGIILGNQKINNLTAFPCYPHLHKSVPFD